MKFTLKIDPDTEESVAVSARCRSPLVDQLESLATHGEYADRITAYKDDDMVRLKIKDIACISITCGKTFAVDRLSLITDIGIHAPVLYLGYILIYLLNGWLRSQRIPVVVFTTIFLLGFALIWLIIRTRTEQLNHAMRKR